MKFIHVTTFALTLAFALVFSSTASAQEIVRKEAPPEIRALFQAFVAGANGDAAAWESFAQAHFTAELLKKETPAQRAEVQKKIQDKFGTIAINGVRRENDGPLQVMVKGSKSEGEVLVDLDFGSSKIFSIGLQ
jgi:hypothetical protein